MSTPPQARGMTGQPGLNSPPESSSAGTMIAGRREPPPTRPRRSSGLGDGRGTAPTGRRWPKTWSTRTVAAPLASRHERQSRSRLGKRDRTTEDPDATRPMMGKVSRRGAARPSRGRSPRRCARDRAQAMMAPHRYPVGKRASRRPPRQEAGDRDIEKPVADCTRGRARRRRRLHHAAIGQWYHHPSSAIPGRRAR